MIQISHTVATVTRSGLRHGRILLAFAAAVLGLGSADVAWAQDRGPVLSVEFDAFPSTRLESTSTDLAGGVTGAEESLEVRTNRLTIDFTTPAVWTGGRTRIFARFAYQHYGVNLDGWDEAQAGPPVKAPKAFAMGASLRRTLVSGWVLHMDLIPGLYSDFEDDVGFGDVRFRSSLAFSRRLSEKLTVGFGLAYLSSYGEGLPLPLASLQWMAGPNCQVDLQLPERAAVWYVPNQAVAFGLAAEVRGGVYSGSESLYKLSDAETRYSVGTFGPSLRVSLTDRVQFRADSGVSFLRRFELHDGSEEVRSLDPSRSTFAKVALRLFQ